MLELLSNAQVYAPEPLGRRHLLVAGGRIAWMGDAAPALPAALGVTVRDLGGRRLIPGLVDGHVHLTGGGGEAGAHTKVPPLALSRFTRGGVTSVVALLGTDDATRNPRELVTAVHGLRNEGLSAWCYTAGYHVPPVTITGTVRGDLAAIECVIGVKSAISDHRSSQPTLDEFLRLASEAHVGGAMTGKAGVLHLHVGDGPRGLALIWKALEASEIPPRVFNPTHVNRRKALFEEALEAAKRGCTVDLTAFPVAEGEDAWPAEVALVRYLDSGAPPERVTISSDGGGCLPTFDADGRVAQMDVGSPGALALTLRALLAAGQPLERVLPAFTLNPARHLRLAGKGRIAVGADADLVVLDDNGGISDVMARGVWHVQEGRQQVTGTFEAAAAGSAS
ncbi:MAG: beta-aspartyl-peptidase [Gemmatimonadales bacterium]|nr:beta-aspartyl-peptidase [Gemmatimonadota bacterium]MCL4214536.1 beta-aspartyl-peptidase [Gemmatimonadales bacterium]